MTCPNGSGRVKTIPGWRTDHSAGLLFFPDSLAGAAAGGAALAGAAGAAGAGLPEEAAEALSCLAAALYPSLR